MIDIDIIQANNSTHQEIDQLMIELQEDRINGKIRDTLIFVEHPEIVTIGRRGMLDGLTAPDNFPSSQVDRGGGLTWHGPGQIVLYPIFKWDLEGESNVKSIISILEEWVIESLKLNGIEANRDERMQGVWVGQNKICSIGLSFLRWTSRHGLTINCDTPPGRVEMVSGCGLGQDTTTSLSALGFKVTKDELLNSLLAKSSLLGREMHEL